MNRYPVENIRNIGLFSHGGAGKTSLAEAMLFTTGTINRLGRVEDGNTVSDWDPDEAQRGMSISTSVIPVEWKEHKLNILDTPGYADFTGEAKSAAQIADCAAILIDASAGVEVGTEQSWRYAAARSLPRAFIVNKIDRENASFESCLESLQSAFGNGVVPLHMPIGVESDLRGAVDLLNMKAYFFSDANDGAVTEADIPEDMLDQVESYRLQLVEKIAENDEELMLKYLEDEALTPEELHEGLRSAVQTGEIVPVLVSAASTNRGTCLLLDALLELAPPSRSTTAIDDSGAEVELNPSSDDPASLFVWKTIADPYVGKLSYFRVMSGSVHSDSHLWNVAQGADERIGQIFVLRGKEQIPTDEIRPGDLGAVAKLTVTGTNDSLCDPSRKVTLPEIQFPAPLFSAAVSPHTNADLDKMSQALARLCDEDRTLHVTRDSETAETMLSGLGESHIQIALQRMSRKFGVNVDFDLPTVPYRETIQTAVQGVEYKHKKQSGGHGQYGHVYLDLSPCDEEFVFEETIFGGAVPRGFIAAVEKGVREAMEHGVLAGFPVINIKVVLTDGSYHSVDSSEMAFKLAASQAFKKAQQSAQPVVLEPVSTLAVTIPDSYTGDVMGDLTTKRAHVTGMEPGEDGYSTIQAQVPTAEIQRYATDLRSITQGRGTFTSAFSHYEPVPQHLTDAIISRTKEKEEAKV